MIIEETTRNVSVDGDSLDIDGLTKVGVQRDKAYANSSWCSTGGPF